MEKDAYIIDTPWSQEDTEKLVDWITERGLDVKAVFQRISTPTGLLESVFELQIHSYLRLEVDERFPRENGRTAGQQFF